MITSIQDAQPRYLVDITDAVDGSTITLDSTVTKVVEVNSQATISITEAIPINFIAASSIIAFKLITTDETGKAVYADANNLSHVHSVFGVAATSAATGNNIIVKRSGIITNTGWTWTAKQFLYLGLNGDITPSQVGLICVSIGYAINATEILLNIQTGTIRG